jgi:hypothetical protein
MKTKNRIAVFLLLILPVAGICYALTDEQINEYRLKAAFMYNFIKFVDWPSKAVDSNEITIGIVGKEPLLSLFESLKERKVKNKTVLIKQFPSFEEIKKTSKKRNKPFDEQIASIQKCNLLFLCSSETPYVRDILSRLKDKNILTVGESENFLNEGGIINFVIEDKKVRFDINLDASDKAKLKISSQLLQLAKKVVKAKDKP